MDKRIGKRGSIKPQLTVQGKPAPKNATEIRNLGNGYYCVVGAGYRGDIETEIANLKKEIGKVTDGKVRKPAKIDSD